MKIKRFILLFIAICFILVGFWFSTTNGYKFAKGYLIYKVGQINKNEKVYSEPVSKGTTEINESSNELYKIRPNVGEKMGELFIPKLNAKLPIYHGTDEDELEKGVGHFAGSVLPGEKDNSVLSGHRDTVFRKLGEVKKGDLLVVSTIAGEFTYKVKQVRIVDKDDRTVIVPKPRPILTVSTCYPFNFLGSAPERYVLVAFLVDKEERSLKKDFYS
ncbi:class D sortase [Fictibacillus nanhaiensis]|uniref:class D sortase n=1 Tax=Fictibacillus nanhaiensis TaxID=742169 RepID=UPI001C982576|nr:class D sortase [Fictibacillus nanhaiensis]MBY6037102.1 class D sortase [Fictibacillus nanhaiensis]